MGRITLHDLFKFIRRYTVAFQMANVPGVPIELDAGHSLMILSMYIRHQYNSVWALPTARRFIRPQSVIQ